jgi:hypothetical protein
LGDSAPTADVSFLGANTVAILQVVGLKAQSAAVGNWAFDTLRIGTT